MSNLLIRSTYLEELNKWKDKHFIKVLTGIRRSGKSTILFQYRDNLIKKHKIKSSQIISYDFNDAKYVSYSYKQLHDEIINKAIKNRINYLFLDEIQEIDEFERCLISLFENKKISFDIYISGSNSKMFSDELATLLTGRTISIKIFPISFKEIYEHYLFNLSPKSSIYQYVKYGGLGITIPIINNNELKEKTLSTVYEDTIAKDVKQRHKKLNWNNFIKISDYVYEHIGKHISSKNLEEYIKTAKEPSLHKMTILKYLDWMCESLILHKVRYFDVKGKRGLITKSKYYAGDLGILSSKISYDLGNLLGYRLENLVFIELLSRGYKVYTYEDRFKRGVDFVGIKNSKITYFQVTTELNDDDYIRESKSLLSIKDANEKIIIALDITISLKKDGIKTIHLFNWLIDKELF